MFNKKAHWEKIYSKSPLEVSWYQQQPLLSLQLIQNAHLKKTSPILDVGGGASVLVDCLCDEGYSRVAVLDISSKALAFAKDRLGTKAKEVTWYEDDVTQFKAPQQYSFWHDRAVFHFLTDLKDRQLYIETVKQTLESDGHLVIAAFAIDGSTQCSGLDIVQYNAEKLVAELGDGFEFIEQIDEGHMTPSGKEQLFSYFYFIKK